MSKPPEQFRHALWDLDFDALDVRADADSILARVLEYGRLADVRLLLDIYGEPTVRRFFRRVAHPLISERTRRFWRAYFKAGKERWARPPHFRRSNAAPWLD